MKNKARLLVTMDCERGCYYCPNRHKHIIDQAILIENVECLNAYKEVMISGGEPLLRYDTTARAIDDLRSGNPRQIVYLYTSIWQHRMIGVLSKIDGIQYTLHKDASPMDVNDFMIFQEDMRIHTGLSYRLAVIESVNQRIEIKPELWEKIVFKPPRIGENCIVPKDEDLYILKG